jgi:hypothetical protein
VRFENKNIFFDFVKTLSPTTYNAGVVVVNFKVLGLAPDLKVSKKSFLSSRFVALSPIEKG